MNILGHPINNAVFFNCMN